MTNFDKEQLELSLLLMAAENCYGYDFHNYAKASLLRRVKKYLDLSTKEHISDLIPLFIHDKKNFSEFVQQLSVSVTEMFRDPDFFSAIRSQVLPLLKTYPFIKIWHAGCATGEEVYSMAIILEEAGLLDRCQIYATDFNEFSLNTARKAIYPSKNIPLYEENYKLSGGIGELSDYYHKMYESIKFNDRLSERITFANHNLVADGIFGEMNIIFCRNVLIYFNQTLQDQVLHMFFDSLCPFGILCIGKRENLQFSRVSNSFEQVNRKQRIYKKKC
ncbi:MAG: protein-glutamate O-methyltransferase CheR [Endozoicomonas sp. (ex Botrylloides leachii)]|nr:protein-glutamate O-methyltransferase CheR [Endozoicomonas sp. (ex Botrylloides leachii)]